MLKAICSRKELSLTGYYPHICDLIDSEELSGLKRITHHISTTRFQHCVNVSYYSYLVCRKLHRFVKPLVKSCSFFSQIVTLHSFLRHRSVT